MTIAVYGDRKLHQGLVEALAARGFTEPVGWVEEMGPEQRAQVEILFGWRIPQSVVDACPRLAWIQGAGAGVDWVLPLKLPPQVVVTRIVDQFGPDMGEFALMAALAWVKEYPRILKQQADRQWTPYLVGQLATKVVGVLGAGSIGRHIAEMFRPLVREVRALGRRPPEIPGIQGFGAADALHFYHGLDILVMVLPHTPDTYHLVGGEEIGRMNRGGYLINVGRGAVLNESALIAAVQSGQLSGACLDVHETEPLPSDSPLWTLPGVTVSPHISGPSRRTGMAAVFLENLSRYRQGLPLVGQVDLARGY
ncbi:D-2-hydroxyacid dehydrogenase [Sulfobacillus harzensis]|uniref:D-2-hydroxyacid dehydrogenase n=1 Tax=Sulfobacillus harzensis TaxID=2729629 RepID=A0A7Y0L596_9FIRM|nr:D-2-hydroxyacid dehydrogenase [Sulfobacillus harzensis]NMP22134.1 D-2-hydroxyacid dehydrogenase [Sulfobacillus harzensis]